jgi:DNA-directed RNA polymerase specialized sigma24 family protein
VLVLFEIEGMSTQEIADLVGAQVGTVRVWLFRARARFLEEHQRLFERSQP